MLRITHICGGHLATPAVSVPASFVAVPVSTVTQAIPTFASPAVTHAVA